MGFKLLCIDMFQTLVDINTRSQAIWERILRENYNEALASKCAKSVRNNVFYEFHRKASNNTEFINLKTMFEPFFKTVLNEMNVSFNANEAVKIFMDEHTKAKPYDDVETFFTLIASKLPVCLVTDADYEMVLPILKKYNFDEIFISEKVKSYKNEPESRIFKEVLKHYSINPSEVLHIGDSSSDIIGANRVGIKTCWINREKTEWKYNIKPDYIINSLDELMNIIENDKDIVV